jgi:hypothetical protein
MKLMERMTSRSRFVDEAETVDSVSLPPPARKVHEKIFSLIAPLVVAGLFATAPLAVAQGPTISIDFPANGAVYMAPAIPGASGTAAPSVPGGPAIGSVTVWVVNGTNSQGCYVKGAAMWYVDQSIPLPITQPGPSWSTLYARCTDVAGNSATASVQVYYDPMSPTSLPTVTIGTPMNGQTFTTSPVTVMGGAISTYPNFGIGLVQVQTNGTAGTWQSAWLSDSNSWDTGWVASVSLSPGANTIYARSEDTAGFFSTNVSVNVTYWPPLAPPMLGTVNQNSTLIFTWPLSASQFVLQCSSNLGAAAVWSTNLPSSVVVGGQNVVTNPLTGSRMFFRLYLSANSPLLSPMALLPAGSFTMGDVAATNIGRSDAPTQDQSRALLSPKVGIPNHAWLRSN